MKTPTLLPALRDIPGKTRYVKDCLRTGRWIAGYSPDGSPQIWDVDESLLETLAANHASQWEAGYRHPLQWGHVPEARIGEAPRAGIADITDLWREGDTLFFAVYVDSETASELTRFDRQVSVHVAPSWQTQEGQAWTDTLLHIAVVDHGAVPGQAPFVQLSASASTSASPDRNVCLAGQAPFRKFSGGNFDDVPQGKSLAASETPEARNMDFETTVTQTNRMLEAIKPGTALPTEGENAVTEENFNSQLGLILDIVIPAASGETTGEGEEAPAGEVSLSAQLAPIFGPITQQLKSLSAQVASLKQEKVEDAKQRFLTAADDLGHRGLPAANVTALKSLGAKQGWDMTLISAFSGVPGLKLGSQTKSLSAPAAPPQADAEAAEAKADKLLDL